MTILKIQKRDNPFVQIDREAIQDKQLSWKARGLLAYLLSMPCNWDVIVEDLIERAPDGRDAVYSILKELKKTGYIIHHRLRDKQGRLSISEYHVFETPQLSPNLEKPELGGKADLPQFSQDVAFPDLVNPDREKPDTYIINNQQIKQITKETAADNTDCNNKNKTSSETAAAVIFDEIDSLIADKLTFNQIQAVQKEALLLKKHFPNDLTGIIASNITHTLLSKKSFTKTGVDFFHKLHVISKSMREGRWTRPVEMLLEANAEMNEKSVQWEIAYAEISRSIASEYDAIRRLNEFREHALRNNQSTSSLDVLIETAQKKLLFLQQKLIDFKKTKPEGMGSVDNAIEPAGIQKNEGV